MKNLNTEQKALIDKIFDEAGRHPEAPYKDWGIVKKANGFELVMQETELGELHRLNEDYDPEDFDENGWRK